MRILLVEDNENLRTLVAKALKQEGHSIIECGDGEDALYHMLENAADLVILDRMLPGMDGVSVLRSARVQGSNLPVLMLTALDAVDDRVCGLEAGADDYLSKPFDMRELIARVHALARRPAPLEETKNIAAFDISLALPGYTLEGPKGSCTLSKKEGELLAHFLRNPHTTLSREALFGRVWGADTDAEAGNLDSYIYFLRRRLRIIGSGASIDNQRGIGFRIKGDEK